MIAKITASTGQGQGGKSDSMKRDLATIKGSRDGLVVYCDDSCPWDELMADLHSRLKVREGFFFAGACVTVDIGERILSPSQIRGLWKMFQGSGVHIKCVTNSGQTAGTPFREKEYPGTDCCSKLPTLTARRGLRSGQDITFPGNVIVMGDVNPGAEIKAAGNILVLGDLRGAAHAGAAGDASAWVGALKLRPVQIRITNIIAAAPQEEPRQPEIARVADGMIVVSGMKDWQTTSNRRN